MIALWLSVALAADLGARLEAVAPHVARAAGRELIEMPAVVIVDDAGTEPPGPAQLYGEAAAQYHASTGAIEVYADVLGAGTAAFSESDGAAVVDCLLAHELAHAVHAQYVPAFGRDPGHALVAEGFATLTGRRACEAMHGHDAAARLDVVMGIGAPLAMAPDDPMAPPYVYAPLWLAAQERAGGWEAVWTAMQSPPSIQTLLAAAEPVQVAGFPAADALEAAVGRSPMVTDARLSMARVGSQLTGGRVGPDLLALPASAGGYWMTTGRDGALTLLAHVATAPDGLAPWVGWRRAQVEAVRDGKAPTLAGFRLPGTVSGLALGGDGDRLWLEMDGYAEVWVATEHHLVMAASREDRDAVALGVLVDQVIAALPEARPATSWDAAMDGPLTHPVPPGAADSWQVHYLRAVHRHIRGDYTGCLALIGTVTERDAEASGRLLDLGHGCAVDAGDRGAADAYVAAAGDLSGFHQGTLVRHVSLIASTGDLDATVALAVQVPGPVSEREQVYLVALLEDACPRVRRADRKRCEQALARFR